MNKEYAVILKNVSKIYNLKQTAQTAKLCGKYENDFIKASIIPS